MVEIDLAETFGFDIPTAGRKGSRSTCSVCGLSKRYVFNRAALEHGYDVVATGHNLDDEAATLLGNTLRWQTDYIARQFPVLPSEEGLLKKVKPLYRLSELETAAYTFLRGIDYVVEECPLVAGNTQLRYKEAMNGLEAASPGTKAQFFLELPRPGRSAVRAPGRGRPPSLRALRCSRPPVGSAPSVGREPRCSASGSEDRPARADDREIAASVSEEVLPAEIYGQTLEGHR